MAASLLMTKSDDKNQTVVTINGNGIYFQELRLGDRPMSPRVKIGNLVLVDGEIMAEYSVMHEYDDTRSRRDFVERSLKAAMDLSKQDPTNAERKAKVDTLSKDLAELETKLQGSSIHNLRSLNAKVFQSVDKLLDKVRYRHKFANPGNGQSIVFTHYPTRAYFMQKQAEDLLKRRNEALEAAGKEDGYIDFDTAMEIIERRYSKIPVPTATTSTSKTAAKTTTTKKKTTA